MNISYQNRLRYVYKVTSSRIRKANYHLNLTYHDASINGELAAIGNHQVFRFIDQLRSQKRMEEQWIEIQHELRRVKALKTTVQHKRTLKKLHEAQNKLKFVPDYLLVVIETNKDYDRLNSSKGFSLNGTKYKRLMATTGGAKSSTVIYVSEDIHLPLERRLNNGRNPDMELVPAKLEAYKALACSTSTPVSHPERVLVIPDCVTEFRADIIQIDDSRTEYPQVEKKNDHPIQLNMSDGFGLISPALSKLWAEELGHAYIPSGFCIRNSFCKGMVFTFDYHEFADRVAGHYMVVDAWGESVDIREVDLIITTSMLKLWQAYSGINDYLLCCGYHGYTFSVTKVTPEQLEDERHLNYQFIQSLQLSDNEIDELISPTISTIQDVLGQDYRKALLFLKGIHIQERDYLHSPDDYIKGLMVESGLMDDPFVKHKIHNLIRKRMNEAKIGVLRVKGNFSIISGDPYTLCQSMFGLPLTGLLQPAKFYSQYWNERQVRQVACFRAPMTCHNNIKILRFSHTEEMQHWYRYMNTVTILNSWDTTTHSLNGADMDSDQVLTTDNATILGAIQELEAIVCVQKTSTKKIPTESDLIQANKDSFGDLIGFTTNKITSMFDVLASYEQDTPEYKEMMYRIQCGQHYQQNAIDQAKGIECKPMPKHWYDIRVAVQDENALKLVADKKPYFFIYNDPEQKKEYNTYIDKTNQKCLQRFGMTVEELTATQEQDGSAEMVQFLQQYEQRMPVSVAPSVMNRLCRRVEKQLDEIKLRNAKNGFDHDILKTSKKYSQTRYKEIQKLYQRHNEELRNYMTHSRKSKVNKEERSARWQVFVSRFKEQAFEICNNEEDLCNMIVDMCYRRADQSKQFVWDVSGEQIIRNLLHRNRQIIHYPVVAEATGEFEYVGKTFRMTSVEVSEVTS
nr:hypothetical protein [Paenibacillus xylanexedens]